MLVIEKIGFQYIYYVFYKLGFFKIEDLVFFFIEIQNVYKFGFISLLVLG